jgi:hypothetical protein
MQQQDEQDPIFYEARRPNGTFFRQPRLYLLSSFVVKAAPSGAVVLVAVRRDIVKTNA